MFPFRAHIADGGDAEAGAEAGFGRAVVMLALDGHAEELPGVLDEPEELVARFAALEGIEAQPPLMEADVPGITVRETASRMPATTFCPSSSVL